MAYQIRLQQIVLCISSVVMLVQSSDLPATFQFDLVFPQEGGNYKPVERFPVVFALHNGSRAGSVPLTLSWFIKPEADTGIHAGVGYMNSERKGSTLLDDPLIVTPIGSLFNVTRQTYTMAWSVGARDLCDASGRIGSPYGWYSSESRVLRFSIDSSNGTVPDIKATGRCATPLFAISVDGEVPKDGSSHEMCGLSPNRTQPVQRCATVVDDEMVEKVAARMLTEKLAPMTAGADSLWKATTMIMFVMPAIMVLHLL